MESTAEFIAAHALSILLGIAAAMLGITFLLWHLMERYGRRLWLAAVSLWDWARKRALARSLRGVPVLGRLFNHTLTVARYLGVYAVLSFLSALAALGLFFELADEIGVDESLARFDLLLSHALALHLSVPFLEAIAAITLLGNPSFLTPLCAVVTVGLLAAKRRLLAVAWAVATACGGLLNWLLKSIFERARPAHEHGVLTEDGWSFPSGHASGSMLVYGLLGYLIIRHTPRAWHLPVALFSVLLIVFVGFSRVLLQVHYLSDVLAGYASAVAWGALCVAGLEAARWRAGQRAGTALS